MQLVDQFYQVPGSCWFTGSSSTDGPILDTGNHVEGKGRIYIGPAFLQEACRLIGWRHPEEVDLVVSENESLKARVAELEAEVADMADIEATLERVSALVKKKPPVATFSTPAPFSPSGD